MKRVVLDIETNTSHDKIWVCVTKDLDTGEVKTWNEAKQLQEYLKEDTLIIGHNVISFDAPILNKLWKTKIRLKNVSDTLILSRLLDPSREKGHSLEAWGKTLGKKKTDYKRIYWRLRGVRNKKDIPLDSYDEWNSPNLPLMTKYCIRDVTLTALLYQKLIKELNDNGFSLESIELEHNVAKIVAEQERHGFKLDTVYATVLLADIKGKMAGIYEQMQHRWPPYEVPRVSEKTGKQLKPLLVTFNPGSRKQIAEKLMELGWRPQKHTDKGSIILNEAVLDEIIKECDK